MTTSTGSCLETLPVELLTQISAHLHLYDLKRFRMVSKLTAEAVFERMVSLMPRVLTVHGKRSEGLQDLAFLGATFKMKHCVTRLSVLHMKPQFSSLLENVCLPKLVYVRLEIGLVGSKDHVISLLENHKRTLRELRIMHVSIVALAETIMRGETQSWHKIGAHISTSSGFQLRHQIIEQVGYCASDGSCEKFVLRQSHQRTHYAPASACGWSREAALEESFVDHDGRERLCDNRLVRYGAPYPIERLYDL